MVADPWSSLTNDNLTNAWSRVLEKARENSKSTVQNNDVNEIIEHHQGITGFSECDIGSTEEWFSNANDPGFHMLSDDKIL